MNAATLNKNNSNKLKTPKIQNAAGITRKIARDHILLILNRIVKTNQGIQDKNTVV